MQGFPREFFALWAAKRVNGFALTKTVLTLYFTK